jgi:hypothetical protein
MADMPWRTAANAAITGSSSQQRQYRFRAYPMAGNADAGAWGRPHCNVQCELVPGRLRTSNMIGDPKPDKELGTYEACCA